MPEQGSNEMTQEQLTLYDRQRFLGLETQKRMLNSLVLITPLNGPNAELAKNLVLSGVRIAVYDPHTIDQSDFETNFLVAHDAIGKNRGQTLLNKLREMNQGAKHQLITDNILQNGPQYFERFTLISTSTKSFKQMQKWDSLCRKINKPYFNLVGVGLYSFSYISLGSKYTFVTKNQKSQSISYDKNQKASIEYIEYDQVTLDSLTFEQCSNPNKIKQQIFYSISMMRQAEKQGLVYDPFNHNQQILQKILTPIKQSRPQSSWQFHTKFARTYGIQFCPVYSVLGSILSQQFIKIISQRNMPAINWLYYDSETSTGQIIQLPAQNQEKQSRKNREDLREAIQAKSK